MSKTTLTCEFCGETHTHIICAARRKLLSRRSFVSLTGLGILGLSIGTSYTFDLKSPMVGPRIELLDAKKNVLAVTRAILGGSETCYHFEPALVNRSVSLRSRDLPPYKGEPVPDIQVWIRNLFNVTHINRGFEATGEIVMEPLWEDARPIYGLNFIK